MPTVTYPPVSKIGGGASSLASNNPQPVTVNQSILWDDGTQILFDNNVAIIF